jgi:hypothetical protein
MKKSLGVVALWVCLGAGSIAHAQYWQMPAGACVPTDVDVSLQGTHYWTVTGGLRVKHKGTDINDINLVCPIANVDLNIAQSANGLKIYYANDGDGAGSNFSITASLRSVTKIGGAYNPSLCTVTSNSSGNSWDGNFCRFTGILDFSTYIYWVEITVHRANTSFTPEVAAVEIVDY